MMKEKNNKLIKKDGHENIDVLLIEDDLATVRLFKEIFKMNGYSYKTAISGQAGLNELKESIPKVVLLNIMLPDIDGYEVCKQIKKNNNLKHIPVFYETDIPEWIVKSKIEETGADGYILKLFDFSTITKLLDSIIFSNRQQVNRNVAENRDKLRSNLPRPLPHIPAHMRPAPALFEKKINDYISLKLENGKTYIYVNGKRFIQCIQLILNIQKEDIPLYDDINSIDEAAKVYKNYIYQNRIVQGPMVVPVRDQSHDITPEQEFWGHCSNLQGWYEHNYDTRLLHSNLAFPLLGALVDAGDPDAKKVFKKEITKCFNSGYQNTLISLFKARVLDYLNPKEKKQLIQQNCPSILNYIENANISPYIFKKRLLDYLNPKEKIQLLQHIENLWKSNPDMFSYIFKIIDYLNPEEQKQLIQQNFPSILKYIENANMLIYIHHIFPNFLKIRGYLNPEEKKQLTQLIKLKKFF